MAKDILRLEFQNRYFRAAYYKYSFQSLCVEL